MNEFIRLDDGLYYRRDAFTTFQILEEEHQVGGGEFRSFDNGVVSGMIQEPYKYAPTGR